jgi:hypothetical protein
MSGANPTADFLFHLDFAALMAVVAVWQTWTWLSLLICIPLGAVVRSYYARRTAVPLGITLVCVILALNTALIGLELADDPDVFRSVWPSYFFPLVLMVCWLVHLPLGLLALGVGIGTAGLAASRANGRQCRAADTSNEQREA